jgi:hypothetical protein
MGRAKWEIAAKSRCYDFYKNLHGIHPAVVSLAYNLRIDEPSEFAHQKRSQSKLIFFRLWL